MNRKYIDRSGWVFEFNRVTFFVTTFAPLYPDSNSRFAFGSESAFILLQPELSFAWHDLPSDTPHTDWEEPKSIRDKIRVAFRNAGRGYHDPPPKLGCPMVWDMVKPTSPEKPIVEWWKEPNRSDTDKDSF